MQRRGVQRLTMAVFAVVCLLLPTAAVRVEDDDGLVVRSYTIRGERLSVHLLNSGKPALAAAVATAVVGGEPETRRSVATWVDSGATATVTIRFSGPILGITEGPDPIPQ